MANITEISIPPSHYTTGGDFEIMGTGFSGAKQVYFIDAASKKFPAKSFTVVSDTRIKGKVPALSSPGPARVYVTAGTDAVAVKAAKSYVAPTPAHMSSIANVATMIGGAKPGIPSYTTTYANEFYVTPDPLV
ncbi:MULTISPECIES: hypothetical protein [Pandoraea]|uniref:hypothetical protein n=1 Tax=Pandoraea TaxID=93217 RepID=UPI001F5D62A6|nr:MULTISPECIES: hypothetical protein [Pandoraea]MCI3205927.1 hypothetical protein [Pandoraea sp. LA3]MDN4583955.1 hypothetical protein [Pandoraea capi]